MSTKRYVYNIFWKDLLSGDFDIDDKEYRAILLDSEYTFSNAHKTYQDVVLYELPARNSYTAGGIPAHLSLGIDAYGRQVVNCDTLHWKSVGGTFQYLTIYEKSSENLVCSLDLGVVNANGSRMDLSFPGGLFVIKNTDEAEHISHKIDIYKTVKVSETPIQPAEDTIYYNGEGPGFYFGN